MSAPVTIDALRQMALLEGLTSDELARLRRLLGWRSCSAGATIIRLDEIGDTTYLILRGFVRVQRDSAGGDSIVLAILGAGEIVGEMSMVDDLTRSAAVTALDDTLLAALDRAAFWACLREMPVMSYNLARVLSRRLRHANARLQALATLDVHARVAHQLLLLAEAYGQPATSGVVIPFRLTQDDLADLVSASRVRVNHALGALRRQGWVGGDRQGWFIIQDSAALARFCREAE